MRKKWGTVAVIALVMMGWMGCGQDGVDEDGPDNESERTGLALGVDYYGDSDVAGFHFQIRQCRDAAIVLEEDRDLEDLELPSGIPVFSKGPFADGSTHQFADFFTLLEAGCYDVVVEPVTDSGAPSSDCQPAEATEVFVVAGMTTEILLISQCEGVDVGATDVIGALNNPPVIESVEYEPSKFVHECEAAEVCVTAFEPDGDPLEFVFEQTGGKQLRFDLEVSEAESDGYRTTQCMRAVPIWYDSYEFQVTVYDQFHKEGNKVRAEDYLGVPSRAQLTFPVHSNWDHELECYDKENDSFHPAIGVREVERAEGCRPLWPHEYYCSEFYWDETDHTCPGGEFRPETVYPSCESKEHLYDMSENLGSATGRY